MICICINNAHGPTRPWPDQSYIACDRPALIETHLLSPIEKHIPTKMPKSKQAYPWITPEIKKNYKESETDTTLKQ